MPPSSQSTNRLSWLDAARGLAALLVLFDHGIRGAFPRIDAIITRYIIVGNFGVVLFFFCSGFIIPISAESCGMQFFWVRRFFRLYPLYWVSIGCALLAGHAPTTDPLSILANITMLEELVGVTPMSSVYWSLTAELLFYLLISLLMLFGLTKRTVPLTIGLILGAILVEGVVGIPPWRLSYLATMCIGTAFYRWQVQELSARTVLSLFCAGIAMLLITRLGIHFDRLEYVNWLMGCMAAYGLFLIIFLMRSRSFPRWLIHLGTISYSLYLIHPTVMYLINVGSAPLNLVLWCVGAISLSCITYYYIERPAIALGRYYTHLH